MANRNCIQPHHWTFKATRQPAYDEEVNPKTGRVRLVRQLRVVPTFEPPKTSIEQDIKDELNLIDCWPLKTAEELFTELEEFYALDLIQHELDLYNMRHK